MKKKEPVTNMPSSSSVEEVKNPVKMEESSEEDELWYMKRQKYFRDTGKGKVSGKAGHYGKPGKGKGKGKGKEGEKAKMVRELHEVEKERELLELQWKNKKIETITNVKELLEVENKKNAARKEEEKKKILIAKMEEPQRPEEDEEFPKPFPEEAWPDEIPPEGPSAKMGYPGYILADILAEKI